MNAHDALQSLATSTAQAVAKTLDSLYPPGVTCGEVSVVAGEQSPFASLPEKAVVVSVGYLLQGATGSNVFVMHLRAARALAAAMLGAEPADSDSELDELELSAVAEATNQMMAAAASASSLVLGEDVEIAPPERRVVSSAEEADDAFGRVKDATSASFTIAGHPCTLVQLVPPAFVAQMTRALDELSYDDVNDEDVADTAGETLHATMRDVGVRVWAEVGRARIPLGTAGQLPEGSIVELTSAADSEVELFVNGLRFARGRLLVTDEGEWAMRIERLELSSQDLTHTPT